MLWASLADLALFYEMSITMQHNLLENLVKQGESQKVKKGMACHDTEESPPRWGQ